MQRLLPALLLTTLLAGCFGPPEPPESATVDTDPALPGLDFAAWTEERGGRIQLHAQVVNHHDEGYWYRVNCGHPWEVELVGPDGPVEFREVQEPAGCAPQHEIMQPQQHIDTLYSWDYQDHDPETESAQPVAPGTYNWTIRFTVRDFDETLEASFQVEVPEGDGDPDNDDGSDDGNGSNGTPRPLADFRMDVDVEGTGPYNVTATVRNEGDASPTFDTGCGHEWSWRILHHGDQVPTEPYGTCAGFETTTFPPGHEETFTWSWDGTVWDAETETASPAPAGEYVWEVRFGLHGTQGDIVVGLDTFQVD